MQESSMPLDAQASNVSDQPRALPLSYGSAREEQQLAAA